MKIPKLSILTEEQVYGDNKLKIFDIIDPRATLTDTAILRGAFVSNCHVDKDYFLSGRTGFYWIQNTYGYVGVCVINVSGARNLNYCNERNSSVRATLPYSLIQSTFQNRVKGQNEIEKIEYGFYPGTAASTNMQRILETAYNSKMLSILGV